jgi:hypothetical protein
MKYLYILLFLVTGTLVSCVQDDTDGVSSITNYPIITVNGPSFMVVNQGDTYVDAGAVSTENGAEIETTTSISNGTYFGAAGVDTNSPDQYIVTYSALNADGFSGNASREVWVANTGDLTTSIEGLYTSSTQRAPSFTPSAQYNDMEYVIIAKTGANTYAISHAIGGYYAYGRGYGSAYAAQGAVITVNDIASNDFSISQAVFPAWGNTVDITDFKVDSANKAITFTGNGNFGNGTFKVQLKQVQF